MNSTALTMARHSESRAAAQAASGSPPLSAEFIERFASDCERFASWVISIGMPGTIGMFNASRKLLDEIAKFEQQQRRQEAEALRVPGSDDARTIPVPLRPALMAKSSG